MPANPRANPLALAALVCLAERPMHAYGIASVLRERHKEASVRLNYGSLYSVIASLQRRGLITAAHTSQTGRLPEKTVYELTEAGLGEMNDWLAELIASPVRDYTAFEAGLSFLPALAPARALELLRRRETELDRLSRERSGSRGLLDSAEVPRLFWVEEEYRSAVRRAELTYVRRLISDIESGELEGIGWWRQIHGQDPSP